MNDQFLLKGNFIDSPNLGKLRCRTGYLLIERGKVSKFFSDLPSQYKDSDCFDYGDKLILPGFIDLHLHAPQYSYAGNAMDLQLLEWLERYTFPEEAKYSDLSYAEKGYSYFVGDLIKTPTTRAVIFATLHTDATLLLMDLMERSGIISYVGKLAMDRNCPSYYKEDGFGEGLKETERWLSRCHYQRTFPIITPRFTITTSDDYMKGLSELAAKHHLPAQSHLDENEDEIKTVRKLCPEAKNYADTYARFNLFGRDVPTIMAHAIYCDENERRLIKENGVYLAHCPTSNENVIAGIAPAANYLRNGYHIGLGSDVAGGHTLNLFAVMSAAIQESKIRYLYIDKQENPLTIAEAFYMATKGGGNFFGKVGSFEEGYEFDAIVIDDKEKGNPLKLSPEERLEKTVYKADKPIVAKFVAGKKLF